MLADRVDGNGRELVIRDTSGDVHVWLMTDDAIDHPTVVVPRDDTARLRVDLATRFLRRLFGERIGLLPPRLRLTDAQRHRYIQLLQAADLYEDGGESRDVAARVLKSEQADLPAIEFKDTAARKRAERLIKQSLALVNSKYLQLLRGG